MSPLEVLLEARELLKDGWTKGTFARDHRGRAVPVCDESAVEFCALGALVRAAGGMGGKSFEVAYRVFRSSLDTCGMPAWNDSATYQDVIAHYDESIATMRSKGEVYA